MKYKYLWLCSILFLLSCSKDGMLGGTLKLEFDQVAVEVVEIYAIEDQTRELFRVEFNQAYNKPQKITRSIELNIGNYYCTVRGADRYYTNFAFQIQSENTTRVVFQGRKIPIVSY